MPLTLHDSFGANSPTVMILMGETASGKSALALSLAQRFDAEIIGADSRQIYRGMEIGTAAPSSVDQATAPHHLVSFLDPFERYSAGRFVSDTLAMIAAIHARGRRVVIVGGTGFYLRALTGDMRLGTPHDESVRMRVQTKAKFHSTVWLHEWLSVLDPVRATGIHQQDQYRIVRALEIALGAKSALQQSAPVAFATLRTQGLAWKKFWLQQTVDVLHERIATRVEQMLAKGFLEEAERVGSGAVAASAVGYLHAIGYLAGQSRYQEFVQQLSRATRQYAKRQRIWLRREPDVVTIDARSSLEQIAQQLAIECDWVAG